MSVTYSQLRDIQKRELDSSTPVEFTEDFYSSMSVLLEQKKSEAFASKSLVSIREYENMRKIIAAIQLKREEKILLLCLRGHKSPKGLTSEEFRFLETLISSVSSSRMAIREVWDKDSVSGNSGVVSVSSTTTSAPLPKVIVLKEIGKYLGADEKQYGPFREGEEHSLPVVEADWLVNSGLAKRV